VMAGIAAEAGYPISFMSFFRIGWPMMWIAMCITVPYLVLMILICGIRVKVPFKTFRLLQTSIDSQGRGVPAF